MLPPTTFKEVFGEIGENEMERIKTKDRILLAALTSKHQLTGNQEMYALMLEKLME